MNRHTTPLGAILSRWGIAFGLVLAVSLVAVLSWTAGTYATSHHVYFGESQLALSAATPDSVLFKGGQAGTSWDPPGDLNAATTYYWRIDEVNTTGVTKGPVWNFTTN